MKIYVTHTPSGFQWGTHPSNMTALDVPISTVSQYPVTYELLGSGRTGVFYRLQTGASGKLRPTEGPDIEVSVGGRRSCSFSTSTSGSYETGYIEVVKLEK